MSKKKKVEKKPSIVSRIDSIIADIRKQAGEEVTQLQAVKQAEISKAVFTLGEIEGIYKRILSEVIAPLSRYDRETYYGEKEGINLLFSAIKELAETKI